MRHRHRFSTFLSCLAIGTLACGSPRRSNSRSDDASATDTAAGSDVATGDDTQTGPTPSADPCSIAHPDGVCEGAGVCKDGACTTPTVSVKALTVTDDAVPNTGGVGAGNGLVEAGEEVVLHPALANTGATNYLSVSGTLTSSDARVTVLEGQAVYDDLIAGGEKAPETGFRVRVGADVPNGTVLSLSLAVVDSKEGAVETLPLRVGVRSGLALGMANPFVDDDEVGQSQGDGDHAVDPGERIELVLDLDNRGQGDIPIAALPYDQVTLPSDAQQVEVRMTSKSTLIEVQNLDNPPTFSASLPAQQTQASAADFDFTVSGSAKNNDGACLDFQIALKAGAAALYTWTEVRCMTFGAPSIGEPCVPSKELCNKLDDDCNGQVDDACTSTCGDKTLDAWEACDDGNKESGDGCSGDCMVSEGCGNGIVDPGEACDTATSGSCPTKEACEAQSDCTSTYTFSGVACQAKCVSKPAAGAACDDKDACTSGDKCQGGTCKGTPMACDAPPANTCNGQSALFYTGDAGTCKAGKCDYPKTTRLCKNKCSQGFCSPAAQFVQVSALAGDFRSIALAEPSAGTGQLVYAGSSAVRMAEITSAGPSGNDDWVSFSSNAGAFGIGADAQAGTMRVAYAAGTTLYTATPEPAGGFTENYQASSSPSNYRDFTAAWPDSGSGHLFLRSADDSKLYYFREGGAGSPTAAVPTVNDLGRAVSDAESAYAPVSRNTGIEVVTANEFGVSSEPVPDSLGGGEPAMAVSADGQMLYVVFRQGNALMLSVRAGGTWAAAVAILNLDGNDFGFSVAANKKGTLCILVCNNETKEFAFFLVSTHGSAGYLVDNTYSNTILQDRATDVITGADGRFYVGYFTDGGATLVGGVIIPDE